MNGWRGLGTGLAMVCLMAGGGPAFASQVVYDEALRNGWELWGWSTISLNETSVAHGGSTSIRVANGAWQAIYLHHAAQSTSGYTNLVFHIHGGSSGGQLLDLKGLIAGNPQSAVALPALTAGAWVRMSVPLASLGLANTPDFDGIWFQDRTGGSQPVFYLDDLQLEGEPAAPTNGPLSVVVDAGKGRRPIDPRIYGVAFASAAELSALNAPLNRSGGNAETRYNWELNAHNRGADWYFESLADSSATPGAELDAHVAASEAAGSEAMVTLSMIGWAPRLGANRGRLASYSIAKYGPQTDRDAAWFADAGNGISVTNSQRITWNDPHDANLPVGVDFQSNLVQHLVARWGGAGGGGVRYYFLDNEHSLWHHTHRDVHPAPAGMDEIGNAMGLYAAMVKSVDPQAWVLGPEEWGWSGFFASGLDQQNGNSADRAAHGGIDYVPWLLQQMKARSTAAGTRLLDVLSLHFYPQGGEYGSDTSDSMQRRRNRSTRALWDPAYVDETWINQAVRLIPRMKAWVASNYPGTLVGLTEYNWGAEQHINGATAQADLLGIFGREGLDIATRWVVPPQGSPTFKAFQIYRNYDGSKSTFGDTSIAVSGADPDVTSVFAAERGADGALTVMVVHKDAGAPRRVALGLTNAVVGTAAQVWQLTSSNALSRLADGVVSNALITLQVPAQSVTLLVVPGVSPPPSPVLVAVAGAPPGWVDLQVSGTTGRHYAFLQSGDLAAWVPVSTNLLGTSPATVRLPALPGVATFYRVRWVQ